MLITKSSYRRNRIKLEGNFTVAENYTNFSKNTRIVFLDLDMRLMGLAHAAIIGNNSLIGSFMARSSSRQF